MNTFTLRYLIREMIVDDNVKVSSTSFNACSLNDQDLNSKSLNFGSKSVIRAFKLDGDQIVLLLAGSDYDDIVKLGANPIDPTNVEKGTKFYQLLSNFLGNTDSLQRHLEIAKLRSSKDVTDSLSINRSGRYFVQISCDNKNLKSQDKLDNKFYLDIMNPLGALPPGEQEYYVKMYEAATSLLGILGLRWPILQVATIGPQIVLGIYQLDKGEKVAGYANLIGGVVGGAASAHSFRDISQQSEIVLDFLTKFAGISNTKVGLLIGKTLGDVKKFVEYVKNNPNAWDAATNTLKIGTNELKVGKEVSDFLNFMQKNRSTTSQVLNWYNAMPGIFAKFLLTLGAAADSYNLKVYAKLAEESFLNTEVNSIVSSESEKEDVDLEKDVYTLVNQQNMIKGIDYSNIISSSTKDKIFVINRDTNETKMIPREIAGEFRSISGFVLDNSNYRYIETILGQQQFYLSPRKTFVVSGSGITLDSIAQTKVLVPNTLRQPKIYSLLDKTSID